MTAEEQALADKAAQDKVAADASAKKAADEKVAADKAAADASNQDWQDKVKGKTQEELFTMYGEAQKKIGELSTKDKQNDELIKQMNVILAAIGESGDREELVRNWVEKWIEKSQGKPAGEGKDKKTVPDATVTDLRKQQEGEIIRRFESKYGLDKLDGEKKKEMDGKIANALWGVADPLGKFEKWEDLVAAIPLTKLETLLERSFYEANRSVIEAKAWESGEIPGLPMGRLTSASLPSEGEVKLTAEEEKIAKSLGVAPEKYLARKKEKLEAK